MVVCLLVFGFLAMSFYLASHREPSRCWRWLVMGIVVFGASVGRFLYALEASQ
jgi:hypothetical protein